MATEEQLLLIAWGCIHYPQTACRDQSFEQPTGGFHGPHYYLQRIDLNAIARVACPESMGFIFGARIARQLNKGLVPNAARMGTPLDRDQFVLRTDSFTAQLHAARAGWGIAALPLHVAAGISGLERVLLDSPFQHVGMWPVGRPEVRSVAYLHEGFGTVADVLNGFVADARARSESSRKSSATPKLESMG